jgi:peptidyl-prolyl cis-trans isomerase C
MAANEQIKARHILVETEDKAKGVIADLKKGGDFAALARERSTGPSASDGGKLGFFGRGQMVPAFEAAAFKLKKGAFTEIPVKTQFGWHVILVEDRKKSEAPSFEDVEKYLRN